MVGRSNSNIYMSYLFFDISPIPDNTKLINATLVLFKTTDFFENNQATFKVFPLQEYFSSETTFNNYSKPYYYISKAFNPFTKKVAVEIDITRIVSEWKEESIINRGLLLKGDSCAPMTCFGSAYNKDNTLLPILRVSYEVMCCESKILPIQGGCTPLPPSAINISMHC